MRSKRDILFAHTIISPVPFCSWASSAWRRCQPAEPKTNCKHTCWENVSNLSGLVLCRFVRLHHLLYLPKCQKETSYTSVLARGPPPWQWRKLQASSPSGACTPDPYMFQSTARGKNERRAFPSLLVGSCRFLELGASLSDLESAGNE